MIVRWVAFGAERGLCGHRHETVVAAWRCAAGDDRDRQRAGRGHSDRTVHAEACAAIISGAVRLCSCAGSPAGMRALQEGAAVAATEAASRVVALRPPLSDPPSRSDVAPPRHAAMSAVRRVAPAFAVADVNRIARQAVDDAYRYRIRRT